MPGKEIDRLLAQVNSVIFTTDHSNPGAIQHLQGDIENPSIFKDVSKAARGHIDQEYYPDPSGGVNTM